VDIHTTDLVRINDITRVLLVYTCQQGVYPRGHVLPLRLPALDVSMRIIDRLHTLSCKDVSSFNVAIKSMSTILENIKMAT
jgi:hypothetical protein